MYSKYAFIASPVRHPALSLRAQTRPAGHAGVYQCYQCVYVLQIGRVDINAPKICGHAGPITDIKWNPFDDHVIASSSDDLTVCIHIVEADL